MDLRPRRSSRGGPLNPSTVIDLGACTGCQACVLACRAEHGTPLGVSRLHVRVAELGVFPAMERRHDLVRCVQCADAPCVAICPTGALRPDPLGPVGLDADRCLGCRACLAACPHDALTMHPETGVADKCDDCAGRRARGLDAACAVACPTGAIQIVDAAPAAQEEGWERLAALGTRPRLRYRGPHPPDALAARAVGLFARAELHDAVTPLLASSPGPALLAADGMPRGGLDARAALVAWTQSLAAGVALVPGLGVLLGLLPDDHILHRLVGPIIGLLYLCGTAAASAWASERRGMLGLLFRGANLSSWLTRGALLSLLLGLLLSLELLCTLLRLPLHALLLVPTAAVALLVPAAIPLALRQCRGRALWRPRSGIARAIAGALTMGGAMLLPFVSVLDRDRAPLFGVATALGALGWLVAVGRDLRVPADGAHARAAALELSRGAWRGYAWGGVALTLTGLLAPFAGAWVTLPVLAGPLLYGHAFLGAGQSVGQG